MPTSRVNGIDIYYEQSGEGRRLLFFNGSGASIESSAPLLSVFRARFQVLVHDQRGLGRTGVPPGPYSMSDYADDALALLDLVGWPSCRVIGVSFGGMVAQEFAVTAPDRVERLVLACTSPGGAGNSSYPLHELVALDEASRSERMLTLLDTRFTHEYLTAHPADRALASTVTNRRSGAKDLDRLRGEREQLLARSTHDVTGRLSNVKCPTLVAAGRFDAIASVHNSEVITERIPNSELRVYEGGHMFFAQDQRAVPDIVSFLDAE